MTKAEFARVLDVSPDTLARWVKKLVAAVPAPFTWEQYVPLRVLPPAYFRFLKQSFDA